jgi:hypothetical protein
MEMEEEESEETEIETNDGEGKRRKEETGRGKKDGGRVPNARLVMKEEINKLLSVVRGPSYILSGYFKHQFLSGMNIF